MTDSCKRWPRYLLEQAIAPPPEGCEGLIVPDSTPVVSFGNPVRATVATIGLNPSALEFLEYWKGPMLPEDQRRLATRESTEISDCCPGAEILDGCAGYFGRNPYEGWFLPLDCILRTGVRASYYAEDRSDARGLDLACHLDLSPWATVRRWSILKGPEKKNFLKDGINSKGGIFFLRQHLLQGNYRLAIVNGSGVRKEMTRFLPKWEKWTHPSVPSGVKLHECQFGNTQILAWSRNIQKEPEHIPALTKFVKERYDKFHNERRTT